MDSRCKRRCDHDRLSDLPDCLLHGILFGLGSRQAVRTSLLSRHLWRDLPCAVIDEREFADETWERFADFVDHMLTSIPPDRKLDAFRLHLVRGSSAASDVLIRRGLQHDPTAVDIRASDDGHVVWRPYSSVSGAAVFTGRLTTLHLVQVRIMDGFAKHLGEYCPVLEKLHMERCHMYINVIVSPTLRSLAVIGPSSYGTGAGPLRITAPRLASMRIEIPYDRWRNYYHVDPTASDQEPLSMLAEASIRLTGLYKHQPNRRLWQALKHDFLKSVCGFLAFLPNVANLHLSGFAVEVPLDEEYVEFPVFHNLKVLLLEECGVGTNFLILTRILRNTPNVEKLGLHQCMFLDDPVNKRSDKSQEVSQSQPPIFWCNKLKSLEIYRRTEDEPRMLKVLSEISEGMQPSWWRRVDIEDNCVENKVNSGQN